MTPVPRSVPAEIKYRRRSMDCGRSWWDEQTDERRINPARSDVFFRSIALDSQDGLACMKGVLKREIKTALGRAVDVMGISARRNASVSTIVAFHRVNDDLPEDGLTCSAAKFEDFCRYFSAQFRVIALREQIAESRLGRNVGGTLSITAIRN